MALIKLLLLLPPALWSGRTVKSIFGAGVDMWTDASSTLEVFFVEGEERSERNEHV
jgi:hypothetical protein